VKDEESVKDRFLKILRNLKKSIKRLLLKFFKNELWLWLNFFLVMLNIRKWARQSMKFFDGRNISERSLSK